VPPPPAPPVDPRPIRERRPFAISGELGWNGLAGLGLNFSWHPVPVLALDTGAGLGLTGLKVGLRVRANFLEGDWSPLLGAGVVYTVGSGRTTSEIRTQDEDGEEVVVVRYPGAPHLQIVGGVNYTSPNSFTFTAMTGYAILLRKNVEYVSGSKELYDDRKSLVGSGIVLSVALGHSF
jgi:hypothetical protein